MADQNNGRPSALVTGASSGIGLAFAERLAKDGYDLILVARRRDRLEELAKKLQESYLIQVNILVADLSKPQDIRVVENTIIEDSNLELLVNNAGFGAYMAFTQLEPDRAEELVNVQVLAVTRLTRVALTGMIARGKGAIINVSSRLALSAPLSSPPLPKRATYAGTKAFINTFTQILANELEGTGVKVQALCPGVVQTEFHERVGIDPARYPTEIVMNPEALVAGSLAGLKLGEVICIPALDDPQLLKQLDESKVNVWEHSRSSKVAERYQL
jgi:uncharacterized protein